MSSSPAINRGDRFLLSHSSVAQVFSSLLSAFSLVSLSKSVGLGCFSVMSPRKLSCEEKGKAIAVASSQVEDTTANGSPLDEFTLLHREAMRDSANMSLLQRLLVADAT